jgi:hypothetical protein
MARAQKRLAADNDDADLALHAIRLERRALEAIALHLSVLPEVRDMTSSVAALVMARTMQRFAEKYPRT